jgi:hypothetical protein
MVETFLSEVTETFAAAYVKNMTQRNFITLIYTVTSATALRSLLPYLSPKTTQSMLRYGWQTAAALYTIASISSTNSPKPQEIRRDDLIDRAVSLQEEHAINFTETCLREHALNPKPVYLQAAHDAVARLWKSHRLKNLIDFATTDDRRSFAWDEWEISSDRRLVRAAKGET